MKITFITAVFIFLSVCSAFGQEQKPKDAEKPAGTGQGVGSGSGQGSGTGDGTSTIDKTNDSQTKNAIITTNTTRGVMILSKPRAVYTDDARVNQISGNVILRVTFKKNGKIGKIAVVKGLAGGLTQQAIDAAKGIKFEPARNKGKAYTVTRNIEYTFTLY